MTQQFLFGKGVLIRMSLDHSTMNWVSSFFKKQSKDLSIEKLLGGISSNMSMIMVDDKTSVVLRQIQDEDWLRQEADVIHHEAAVLEVIQGTDVPVPQLIAVDNGHYLPYPSLLMSTLTGAICLQPDDFNAWLHKMAITLGKIHHIECDSLVYYYNRYSSPEALAVPSWTSHRETWQALINFSKNNLPIIERRFIHRDYHPNNLLWTEGEITGVVDWINACIGPRGVDVGHCRWNLAMIYGIDVADEFLNVYIENNDDFVYDVYWDIVSLLDVLSDPLDVYEGWNMFMDSPITTNTMAERMDQYMLSLWEKVNE